MRSANSTNVKELAKLCDLNLSDDGVQINIMRPGAIFAKALQVVKLRAFVTRVYRARWLTNSSVR